MTHKTPRFNYKDHHLHHPENCLDLQFQLENCCLGFHWGICKKRSLLEEWKLMLNCTITSIYWAVINADLCNDYQSCFTFRWFWVQMLGCRMAMNTVIRLTYNLYKIY